MMTYQTQAIAEYRIQEARDRAEERRQARAARTLLADRAAMGVIDAVGHGLIAIGSRLVSDSKKHPSDRRAA